MRTRVGGHRQASQHREAVDSLAALLPRSPPNNGFINGTLAYSMEASENATHVSAPFQ